MMMIMVIFITVTPVECMVVFYVRFRYIDHPFYLLNQDFANGMRSVEADAAADYRGTFQCIAVVSDDKDHLVLYQRLTLYYVSVDLHLTYFSVCSCVFISAEEAAILCRV